MWKGLLIAVICVSWTSALDDTPPTVVIEQGTVIGATVIEGGFEYVQYLGIPYAGSTAGPHRFRAPTDPPTFEDDFVADRTNIKCIRPVENGYEGTEDCLVANIYVPATATVPAVLPVMVWIEGSEFQNTDYPLSFRHLLEQDVIVVTLNYRESIFGFLCLGVEQAPGNAGLKDVLAGLRWINTNIVSFGGNVGSVTLFGHGSGAAVVDLITLSPMSRGLVHKAITQSGSSLAPWAISYDPRGNAIAVAEKLGHIVTDEETLADILERASAGVLVAAIKELGLTDNTLAFAPCIENKELEDELPLFTEPPYEIISNGDYNQIPYITGFVQNEGTIRSYQALEDNWLDKMEESFVEFLQQDLHFDSEEERQSKAEEIRDYYFQGRLVEFATIEDFFRYHGDTMILISAIRNARLRAGTSEAPVYLYQFSYKGSLGEPFVGPIHVTGAAHGEDLAYLFDAGVTTEPGGVAALVRNAMVERWTNFAKNGSPHLNAEESVEWSPVTTEAVNFLHIFNNLEDASEDELLDFEVPLVSPHQTRMQFWDDIYEEHYREVTSVWDVDGREDEDDEAEGEEGEEEGEGEGEGDGEGEGEGEGEGDGSPGDATRNIAMLFSILTSSLVVMTLY